MQALTKAQVRQAAATTETAVVVAPTKPVKKVRAPKTVEQALATEIGAAATAPTSVASPAPSTKPAKAPKSAPAPSSTAPTALYAMPAGVVTRPGTRKAAVYDAMCAISPATRADLVAAAEKAEQEWRGSTKRLEAEKPGAKWFRRFAPVEAM